MKYKYLIFFLLLLNVCIYAQLEGAPQHLITKAKKLLLAQNATIFKITHGNFFRKRFSHSFALKSRSNYQLLLLTDSIVYQVRAELRLNKGNKGVMFPKNSFADIKCYHWDFMTFNNAKAHLSLRQKKGSNRNYTIIFASGGSKTKAGFARTKVITHSGRVFEISGGNVFRNGRMFFPNNKAFIVSLCPRGDIVFMRSARGEVFKGKFVFYRVTRGRLPIIKLVSDKNYVFMLRADGAILRDGFLVYKRKRGKKAVDLLEESGVIWIIREDGKRQVIN